MSADYLVLGIVNHDAGKTPLDFVLQDMPGDYVAQYAQVLKAVNTMVLQAQKDGEVLGKKEE